MADKLVLLTKEGVKDALCEDPTFLSLVRQSRAKFTLRDAVREHVPQIKVKAWSQGKYCSIEYVSKEGVAESRSDDNYLFYGFKMLTGLQEPGEKPYTYSLGRDRGNYHVSLLETELGETMVFTRLD